MASFKTREWIDDKGARQHRVDATITRKGNRRQCKTFRTRGAAQRWARLVEAEMEKGAFKSTDLAERMTLADAVERYIEEVAPTKKSVEQDKSTARRIVRELGRYPLIAVDAPLRDGGAPRGDPSASME